MNEYGCEKLQTLPLVLKATRAIAWTPELARAHFYILRAVGYAFALRGNFQRSFKTFDAAADVAPTELERVLTRADRYSVLQDLCQDDSIQAQLLELDIAVQRLNLDACVEADVAALLLLGEHIAKVNVRTARSLQAACSKIKSEKVRLSSAFSDRRYVGQNLRVESALAITLGEPDIACELDRQAFELFERIGNRWCAGRVALDLSMIDGGEPYREYARDTALLWPNSSFAVRAARQHPQIRPAISRARKARFLRNA